MSASGLWTEEALTNRHPRYRALFARRDRSRSVTKIQTPKQDTQEQEQQEPQDNVRTKEGDIVDGKPLAVRARGASSPPPPLPAAPKPSADEAIHEVNAQVLQEQEASFDETQAAEVQMDEIVDIWAFRPAKALDLLCSYIQCLVDEPDHKLPKPPTPPSSGGSSHDASPAQTPGLIDENHRPSQTGSGLAPPSSSLVSPGPTSPQHPFLQRVPRSSRTPIDSPVSHPQSPISSSHPTSPLALDKRTHFVAQSDKLARKFYCKSAPPVTLKDYLTRIHKFCPMSVACYMAAGVYIDRLVRKRSFSCRRGSFIPLTPVSSNSKETPAEQTLFDRADISEDELPLIEVTPKSVHRLLLAALRVANKALEDGVFPHRRMAMVGGVSELELSRLEVSMCFLTDFELVLSLRDMEHWVRRVKALILQRTEKTVRKASDAG